MLRCTYGVGGGVRSGCQLMADGAMGWSGAAREERKRRKIKIRVKHVKHSFSGRVYQKGGSATATKSFGRNSGVRQNLGFTQKNFASVFEYSTVVPRLQRYVWMWYWRHRISSEGSDVLESLGALMSKVNEALGYWK